MLSHHEDCRIFLQVLLEKLSEYYSHQLGFSRATDIYLGVLPSLIHSS